jgi:hypothetical protein
MLLGIGNFLGRGSGRVSGAAQMLAAYSDGLAIDFRDLSVVIKDTGTPANAFSGNPNSKLTYASPSTKWILGANGFYQSGTTLRTEYDAAGSPLGIRIEEARTNLVTRSSDPSLWGLANFTFTAGSTTGPDGTASGTKVQVTATGGANAYRQIAGVPAAPITFHMLVKKGSGATDGNRFAIYNASTGSDVLSISINYDTLAIAYGVGSSGASIAQLSNGWLRVTLTASSGISAGNTINVYTGYVGASETASEYFYFWNSQVEAGSTASSPIITAGSTVTRAVDSIKIATTDFPWNGGTGTLTVDGVVTTPTTDATHLFLAPRSGQTHVSTFKWVPA